MLLEHAHRPGAFDPGHCQDCTRETELLDHYRHVQQQERALTEAHRWARQARHYAICTLGSSSLRILLATIVLLMGLIHVQR
jgi:hypothetical protein